PGQPPVRSAATSVPPMTPPPRTATVGVVSSLVIAPLRHPGRRRDDHPERTVPTTPAPAAHPTRRPEHRSPPARCCGEPGSGRREEAGPPTTPTGTPGTVSGVLR